MGNLAYQIREKQAEQHVQVKKVLKKKKAKISIGEKFLYAGFGCTMLLGSIQIVSNQASLFDVNAQVQKVEAEIRQQERVNNQLSLQVSELSTYERIWAKAKEGGLDLNENNVRVVRD